MTPEQKFFFDLRGWILLPSVLSPDEVDEMKAEVYAGAKPHKGSNDKRGTGYEGLLQKLLDHPAIVGILSEILAQEDSSASDECYAFRCENSFTTIRHSDYRSVDAYNKGIPHGGGSLAQYQVKLNRIFSGLTRVVWELEEVKTGQGGTLFLTGSHKAAFGFGGLDPYAGITSGSPWEQEIRDMMEDYSCPPGSVVIFTESLLHATNDWTNPDNPRVAVFNCYNSLLSQWHRLDLDHEIIMAMPPKRRSLFRGVWAQGENRHYSLENRSM